MYKRQGKEEVVEELYAQFHARLLFTLREVTSQASGDTKETLAGLVVISDVLQQFKFISQDVRTIQECYPSLKSSLHTLFVLLLQSLELLVSRVIDNSDISNSQDTPSLLAQNLLYTLINFGSYDDLLDLDEAANDKKGIAENLYLHFLPFL